MTSCLGLAGWAMRTTTIRAADTNWETTLASRVSGYIRFLDARRLVALAKSYHVKVDVLRRVGHFVPAGSAAHEAFEGRPPSRRTAREELLGAFDFGPTRTLQQDVEFGVLQIVDIALKAISPAVNDPTTAIGCVDQLSRILIRFASREMPSSNALRSARGLSRSRFMDRLRAVIGFGLRADTPLFDIRCGGQPAAPPCAGRYRRSHARPAVPPDPRGARTPHRAGLRWLAGRRRAETDPGKSGRARRNRCRTPGVNRLHSSPVPVKIYMQPWTEAETFGLADLRQPNRALAQYLRSVPSGIRITRARRRIQRCELARALPPNPPAARSRISTDIRIRLSAGRGSPAACASARAARPMDPPAWNSPASGLMLIRSQATGLNTVPAVSIVMCMPCLAQPLRELDDLRQRSSVRRR